MDRALAFWQRFSPLAKLAIVPLGLLVRRRFLRRHRLLGALVRWGPLAASVARGFGIAARDRNGSAGDV
jgi:integral membrane sensor domain MASE1